MAKKKSLAREYVWLKCTETGDLNYRVSRNKNNMEGALQIKKYCPRLRRHTLHKEVRK
ncbi:MAG: 50S ribosomal protein L33 [Planctomycetota bacterium]